MKRKIQLMPALWQHFHECGFWHIALGVFFLLGLILGIFSNGSILELSLEIIVIDSFGKAFFNIFIISFLVLGIGFVTNFVIYTLPFSIALIVFKGLLLGRNCMILIQVLKVTGILYSFLFYIPMQLIINIIIIGGMAIVFNRNIYCHKNRLHFFTDMKLTLTKLAVILVLLFIVSIIFATISSILYSTVIIFKL